MTVKQLPPKSSQERYDDLWQSVRRSIDMTNAIVTYLNALAASFGRFSVQYSDSVTTGSGTWTAIQVTFETGRPVDGWTVDSGTRITATKDQGEGWFTVDFTASGLGNNRTHHVGLRLNGDDDTIESRPFNTRDGYVENMVTLTAHAVTTGTYVELVVSSDTAETWDIDGHMEFMVSTATILPDDSLVDS